ncbi:MAG: DUF3025 domain-containing protein [Clostridia bacterium]
MTPWLARLAEPPLASLDELNAFAAEAGIRVASGAALRFVAPSADKARYGEYELQAFETGRVATRPDNLHDLFNALAWLAFPRTKAALNARHAAAIPAEHGRRGPLRDLLTLLDEGGAIVVCDDPLLAQLLAKREWSALFWEQRERTASGFDVRLLGHAALEQALKPWPGLTCKALVVAPGDADGQAADWVRALPADASPRVLPPLPIFGVPGWWPGQDAAFYADRRYFRAGAGLAR